MPKTNEKGITLVALVVTIIMLIIIASIGVNSGYGAIEYAKYNELIAELKIMQTKVNELNERGETEIGEELNGNYDDVFNSEEVSSIIFANKTSEQKADIKNGFRYCSRNYINTTLGQQEIVRDLLINVEKKLIICCEPITYQETKYYMLEQTGSAQFDVDYVNKNSQSGNYTVNSTVDTANSDRYYIQITIDDYDGYNENWTVRYKLQDADYWETSNSLNFYVYETGTYIINVIHGNEVNLGEKTITISK